MHIHMLRIHTFAPLCIVSVGADWVKIPHLLDNLHDNSHSYDAYAFLYSDRCRHAHVCSRVCTFSRILFFGFDFLVLVSDVHLQMNASAWKICAADEHIPVCLCAVVCASVCSCVCSCV